VQWFGQSAMNSEEFEMKPTLLAVEGVEKHFDGVHALKSVSFDIRPGEVHALVGANGAGKSTLAKAIVGHIRPNRVTMTLGGKPVEIRTPRDAIANGIAMVTQQLSLAKDLSVTENILLPELGLKGRLRPAAMRRDAAAILASFSDLSVDVLDSAVGSLPTAHCQIVEIAKALAQNANVIIFDEPTTSLTPHEVERLFIIIRRLAADGKGLVFVSHRLEEIFSISDRVTVLRDGLNVGKAEETSSLTQAELIRRMIGHELGDDVYGKKTTNGRKHAIQERLDTATPALEVRNLKARPAVEDVSFKLWPGEILGVAGLVGAGRTETVRAVQGLQRVDGGTIFIDGQDFRPRKAADAINAGVVMIPEDRNRLGLIPHFSVRENAMLSVMALEKNWFGLPYGRLVGKLRKILDSLGLSLDYLDSNVLTLSGGMQQKVVISRALLLAPRVLLVDEPTQGVDVGTRSEIYSILHDLAAKGLAVLFISSDFEEVLGISDRIIVITEGRVAANLQSDYLDEEKLAMFAAPRSSTDATHRLLGRLASNFVAQACWIYLDRDMVYCFNLINDDAHAAINTGFSAGTVVPMEDTRIGQAIACRGEAVWQEQDGICTLLVAMLGPSGQSMGWIGLSRTAGSNLPDPQTIADIVAESTGN
jgi:ABC-type sugar transport system ATPase subunit